MTDRKVLAVRNVDTAIHKLLRIRAAELSRSIASLIEEAVVKTWGKKK